MTEQNNFILKGFNFIRGPAAKRRRQEEEEAKDKWRYEHLTSSTQSMVPTTTRDINQNVQIEVPRKSYQVYDIHSRENTANSVFSTNDNQGSILTWIYNTTNARHRSQEEEKDKSRHSYRTSSTEGMVRTVTPNTNENVQTEVKKKPDLVYNTLSKEHTGYEGSILISRYNSTNGKRTNSGRTPNTEESFEMGNAWMKPPVPEIMNNDVPTARHVTLADSSVRQMSNFKTIRESFHIDHHLGNQGNLRSFSTPPFNTDRPSVLQSRPGTTSEIGQPGILGGGLYNFKE
jgi:hypothetical protein